MRAKFRIQRSNGGFSFVELIVVVAILGILSSLVIPHYEKISFRAKSSEAKVLLSALFASEKAFFVEYGAYHSRFTAIGFAPEGSIRYNVGFRGISAFEAGPANGYNTVQPATYYNTNLYCDLLVGATPGAPGNSCRVVASYYRFTIPPNLGTGFEVTQNDFLAGAVIEAPTNVIANLYAPPISIVAGVFRVSVREAHAEFHPQGASFHLIGMNSSKAIVEKDCNVAGRLPGITISYAGGAPVCP